MPLTPHSSPIPRDSRIYVAGHRGLAGSALMRRLAAGGFSNLITRTHAELDLTDQPAVRAFFKAECPEYVFLAAAKVGGIVANSTYPAEFIYSNLAVQTNVIHEAWRTKVKRLLFLGSSCIFPRDCPQPMAEESLLTGPLEFTNRPYAVAKIAGIEMCWAYNRQYGTRFLATMPNNLYGPGDHYDLQNAHVLPALIRKFHEAKVRGEPTGTVWGSGKPYREFLYSDDMADACVFLVDRDDAAFDELLESFSDIGQPPLINIGSGAEVSIRELAEMIKQAVGYPGKIVWDATKPDGTPRKLLDTGRLAALGWVARTSLTEGIPKAYQDFLASAARNKA
jgi:GDP-L-fucose synthase